MNRKYLNEELETLKEELARMCRIAEEMIADAVKSLLSGDRTLAAATAKKDARVDELELTIEKHCMRILLREQPVASDFRTVSTTLKVITDIERIGDQAEDIADTGLLLSDRAQLTVIGEMGALAVGMVRDAVNSFLRGDEALANKTAKADDAMDAMFLEAKKTLLGALKGAAADADDCLYLLMIAKYLERIGDHAVNVSEWTKYFKSGVHEKFQ